MQQQLLLEQILQAANKPALGKEKKVTFPFCSFHLLNLIIISIFSATRPMEHQRLRGKWDEDLRRRICTTPNNVLVAFRTESGLLLGSPTAQNSHPCLTAICSVQEWGTEAATSWAQTSPPGAPTPFSAWEDSLSLTKPYFHCWGIKVAAHPPLHAHTKTSSFPAQPFLCRHHQRLLVTAPCPQNVNAPRRAQTLYFHAHFRAKLLQHEAKQGLRAYTFKNAQTFAKEVLLFLKTACLNNIQCISTSAERKHYAEDPSAVVKAHCLSSPICGP